MNIKELIQGAIELTNSKDLHSEIIQILTENGYKCTKEVKVPNRGDGRGGRIDVVASKVGEKVAIEIDRKTPRKKSLYKLSHYDCDARYVVTREPKIRVIEVDSIANMPGYRLGM